MREPLFLTLTEVLEIHKDQIQRYGGESGLRDIRLLESAIAQPESSFDGKWLHKNVHEMAAAYAFHICQNHPFVDGNKRVGAATALVFLELNRVSIKDLKGLLLDAILQVAKGQLSKSELTEVFLKVTTNKK